MSRTKIRPKKKHPHQKTQQMQNDDLVADTAAVFTSSTEIAGDFAYQCERQIEDIEIDLAFNRLGHEIWNARPGVPQDLVQALACFITERERHRQALGELLQRFDALAAQDSDVRLDPPADFYDLIRKRIFPDPTTKT